MRSNSKIQDASPGLGNGIPASTALEAYLENSSPLTNLTFLTVNSPTKTHSLLDTLPEAGLARMRQTLPSRNFLIQLEA
jgi:hypothetical protein